MEIQGETTYQRPGHSQLWSYWVGNPKWPLKTYLWHNNHKPFHSGKVKRYSLRKVQVYLNHCSNDMCCGPKCSTCALVVHAGHSFPWCQLWGSSHLQIFTDLIIKCRVLSCLWHHLSFSCYFSFNEIASIFAGGVVVVFVMNNFAKNKKRKATGEYSVNNSLKYESDNKLLLLKRITVSVRDGKWW